MSYCPCLDVHVLFALYHVPRYVGMFHKLYPECRPIGRIVYRLQACLYVLYGMHGCVPYVLYHAPGSVLYMFACLQVNLTVIRYYEGLPASLQPAASREDQGVWDRHRGLLIALIVIASICLLVILIAICCIKCRRNRGSWSRDDEKVSISGCLQFSNVGAARGQGACPLTYERGVWYGLPPPHTHTLQSRFTLCRYNVQLT